MTAAVTGRLGPDNPVTRELYGLAFLAPGTGVDMGVHRAADPLDVMKPRPARTSGRPRQDVGGVGERAQVALW